VIGVRLTGQLQGWAAPKDVVLSLVGKLTVQVCVCVCVGGCIGVK
jgi:aconitase A